MAEVIAGDRNRRSYLVAGGGLLSVAALSLAPLFLERAPIDFLKPRSSPALAIATVGGAMLAVLCVAAWTARTTEHHIGQLIDPVITGRDGNAVKVEPELWSVRCERRQMALFDQFSDRRARDQRLKDVG